MTPNRLFATFTLIAVLFSLHCPAQMVRAQEPKPKGFDYAKPKATEAPPAVPVVRAEEIRPVKMWELNQNGFPAKEQNHIIPVVESVTLYSNGRIRMQFAIKNISDNHAFCRVEFARCYVADDDGESYPSLAQDIPVDDRGVAGMEFKAGTKTRFWQEFDAPKKPKNLLKVNLHSGSLGGNGRQDGFFLPFIIKLPERISAKMATSAKPEAPTEPGGGGQNLAIAMRAITKESQRFEGSYVTAKGIKEAVGVTFQPDTDDEDGVIAWYSPLRATAAKIKLQGWIMPDAATTSGLIIKMRGPNLTYRFSLDGKVLSGLDNKGGTYKLSSTGKDPG